MVKDLWWPQTKYWNETMVHSIFMEENVDKVIELRVPQKGEDKLIWLLESFGHFSVKSKYHAQNVYHFNSEEA